MIYIFSGLLVSSAEGFWLISFSFLNGIKFKKYVAAIVAHSLFFLIHCNIKTTALVT